jgi:hypothetical protein
MKTKNNTVYSEHSCYNYQKYVHFIVIRNVVTFHILKTAFYCSILCSSMASVM